jgi:hypothetical protein
LKGFWPASKSELTERWAFLCQPEAVAGEAGLTDHEVAAPTTIHRDGLVMAAYSYRIECQPAGGRGIRTAARG